LKTKGSMQKIVILMLGGAVGTVCRYTIAGLTHKMISVTIPIGTLIVNASGSLIIGLLWGYFESSRIQSDIRTFLFIGILGSYTTFSTYVLESMNLFRDGEVKMAMLNILSNNLIGLTFVFGGFFMIRYIMISMRL